MTGETEKQSDTVAYDQAIALLGQGRVDEGIEILKRIYPRMPKALGDLLYAYRARGDNDSAFKYLQLYVERFPEDPGGWALMAQIARERNDLDEAENFARRAVAADLGNARLWFDFGEILLYARKWKAAARAYAKCLKLDPQFSKAHVRRQYALRLLGLGPLHWLVRLAPIRWVLRMFLSSGLVSELIERDMGIALDDPRWQMPLEWEGALKFVESAPADQAPDRFAAHFGQCRCPFWQWFRSLGQSAAGASAQPALLQGRMRKVLEVGGDPGHIAHHFALAGLEVLSLTGNEAARRDREQRGITTATGDFHLTDMRGNSFDLLVADYALQRSRAPLFALWEWRRLLRPDGCLLLMAHLPVDRPAPGPGSQPPEPDAGCIAHFTYGVAGHVMTLTYWQLRRLFKVAGLQLIAETLEDPARASLESVAHVDGRWPADRTKPWNAFFLLRKPGRLPYDGALEKPRPPERKALSAER
jgi:SAM-dependent methyltransferase